MTGSLAAFLAYVAVKYLAYAFWSGVGILWLGGSRVGVVGSALKMGSLRLLIGIGAGFSIFLVGAMMHWNAWPNPFVQYLSVYAPVRWFEWGIMELVTVRSDRPWPVRLIAGDNLHSRFWRIGGVLVSHFADLPLILSTGGFNQMLPVGRFLC